MQIEAATVATGECGTPLDASTTRHAPFKPAPPSTIYKDSTSDWILELMDAAGNSHVWDDPLHQRHFLDRTVLVSAGHRWLA